MIAEAIVSPMPTLSVKNYRPFGDSPARVTVEPGFTAFVGPNNCGKSSLLKLAYECRDIWEHLKDRNTLVNFAKGTPHFAIKGVGDPLEIFHDRNDRPLVIEISFPPGVPQGIAKAELTLHRPGPGGNHVPTTLRIYSAGYDEPLQDCSSVTTTIHGTTVEAVQARDARVLDVRPLTAFAFDLLSSTYVGPFRNAITEGKATYFDLVIGTSFIEQWHEMKTGTSRQDNERAVRVEDDIARIFGFDALEINAAESNQTLQVRVNRRPYKLRELGGGLAQFIVTYGNMARRRPAYILLDEPELNLHPSLQLDFLTSLAAYGTRGIVFATHSLGLARAAAERVYSFRVEAADVRVRDFEQTTTLAEFVGEMSFGSYRELGFDAILLVEGSTDVKTIQQFLRRLRKDHTVVILPLGGDQLARGDVEAELLEVTRISTRVFAIVDSERESASDAPAERRRAFAEACARVGITALVTERRAIENYLTDAALKAAFGPSFRSLAAFERLKDATVGWSKAMNWRAAREMTEAEILSTDVGQFLATI